MNRVFFLLLALFLTTGASAQKVIHDPNAELRNVGSFHAVEVSMGIDLMLSNGDEAVAISAKDAGTRGRIKTEVKNGVLKIWFEWKQGLKLSIGGNNPLKAYVSFKKLDRVSASGGADVHVDGSINAENLSINLSGGSDFDGKVMVKSELEISVSGGSDMDISGEARKIKVDASGGSDLNGFGLKTEECTVEASGGSDISITANKEITAEASGASDINWKGTASVKKIRTSGSGSINHN